MTKSSLVTIDEAGSLVLPEAIRRELDLVAGDIVVAWIESDRLVLERPSAVLERLKARFAELPPGVSLADELIAERREEEEREAFD